MFRLNVKRTRIRRLGARIPNEVLERCIYWVCALSDASLDLTA
jgi:hypothetical protein